MQIIIIYWVLPIEHWLQTLGVTRSVLGLIFFKAQFKRCNIVVSNLIVFKLDCRMTVYSNVELNLVVPDSTDSTVKLG